MLISHYSNDLYNCGWNSGLLANYGNTVDWGSSAHPYIKITSESSTGCVYVKDSSLTGKGIHMTVALESGNSTVRLRLRKKADVSSYLTYSDSSAEKTVSTDYVELYGKNPLNSAWVMSDYYCGVSSMNTHRIQRIWYD